MQTPENEERIVPMRLQKFLARAGAASRRGSEDLMTAGRVCVNGQVATELGTKVDPLVDVVTVDGRVVSLSDGNVYLVLNKPEGCLTTMDDPYGRPTVASLVPTDRYPGLFPVGRLDQDTTGVLLFMTDGELAARLLHPSTHVDKTYHARVAGRISPFDVKRLCEGVELDDGMTAPAEVRTLSDFEGRDVCDPSMHAGDDLVEVVLHEGRKRQVKRMLSYVGHPVFRLNRVSFGPITAAGLPVGKWRLLNAAEVEALRKATETGRYTGTRPGVDPRSLKKS